MTPLLATLPECADALGIGLTKTRELIEDGKLPTVRFGRAVRVPVDALRSLVETEAHKSEPA